MIRPLVAIPVALAAGLAIVRCATTLAPLASATPAEYCATLTNYVVACGLTDPCSLASVQECETAASGYTPAARGALTTCLNGITCGGMGAEAGAYCAEYWLAFVSPTDAQARLAEDYCKVCPPASPQTTANCVSGFYATIDDAGAEDGGAVVIPGVGFPLLPRSDTVATSADTQCVPKGPDAGARACAGFGPCALQTIEALIPAPVSACAIDASAGADAAVADADAADDAD